MSGVVRDETNPVGPSDEKLAAEKADQRQAPDARQDTDSDHRDGAEDGEEARTARRAPHLRVVSSNEDIEADEGQAAAPRRRIGAIIRTAREDQGLTLETVAKETRIHLSHLRAIEDMTPNLLGAPVYAKGYIRNYARHLKLDPDETLTRYLAECAILTDPEKQDIAPPVVARKLPLAVPVLGILVIALAVTGAAVFMFNSGETPRAAAGPDGAGGLAAAQDGSGAVVTGPALRIVALNRARIEVRGADGTKFLARFFSPGESYTPRVGAGWTVTTDDGAAFEWRLGDDSLGPLSAGGPVFAQSVDAAALRQPVNPPPQPVARPPRPSATDANALEPAAAPAAGEAQRATPQAQSQTPVSQPQATPVQRAQPQPAQTQPAQTQAQQPQAAQPRPAASAPARPPAAQAPAPAPVTAAAPAPSPAEDPAMLAYPEN